MDLWWFLQCFGRNSTVPNGSEPPCQGDSAMKGQETNGIITRALTEGRPRMDFPSIKIGQPKVIKVWMAYYRWDQQDISPVIDDLWVEIGWNGSEDRERQTLKYAKVMKMDGGEHAIAEFGLMS